MNERGSTTAPAIRLVMGCTLLSRILGFARTALIGAIFGGSGRADILNAVFSIPNNLRALLAEGAFSSALIPEMAKSLAERPGGSETKALARNLIGFQLVVLVPFLLLCQIFPEVVVGLFIRFADPEKRDLSIRLFRWLIFYLAFVNLAALLMAVQNTHKQFLIPALAPLLFSIGIIVSLLFLYRTLGIFSMVVGVLLGGLGQLLVQYPAYRRQGYSLKPSFHFQEKRLRRVLRTWGPILLSSSLFTLNQHIAIFFASGLLNGSVSALINASIFTKLPFGLFYASIATVLFPQMSRRVGRGDIVKTGETLEKGCSALAAMLIPSAVFFIVMGKETIALTLQRGLFTAENTAMTSRVLTMLAWGLLPSGLYAFVQRFFYSVGNVKLPVLAAGITVFLDILLSLFLKRTSLAVSGLALASTLSFAVGFLLLLLRIPAHCPQINGRAFVKTLVKIGIIMNPALLVLLPMRGLLRTVEGTAARIVLFLGAGVGFFLVTLCGYRLFRVKSLILERKGSPYV